jgi:hypothetical protein
VCGRTLLRGERADIYLSGGERRSVCELCKGRAVHEGWVREGTVPAYEAGGGDADRRRGLFGRLRGRGRDANGNGAGEGFTLGDELDERAWSESEAAGGIELSAPSPAPERRPRPEPSRAPRQRRERSSASHSRSQQREPPTSTGPREPRHVRAVPSGDEQKTAAAVEIFNRSEHCRTISGVARSLGEPSVAVAPVPERPSLVNLTVAWELCWYRYDVDLSEEDPVVRVSGQGYELDELQPGERTPNVLADERGRLSLP